MAYVVVAEACCARGKPSSLAGTLLAAVLLAAGGALAQTAPGTLPTGGQLVSGQA